MQSWRIEKAYCRIKKRDVLFPAFLLFHIANSRFNLERFLFLLLFAFLLFPVPLGNGENNVQEDKCCGEKPVSPIRALEFTYSLA